MALIKLLHSRIAKSRVLCKRSTASLVSAFHRHTPHVGADTVSR